jgi:hypothetical protein
LAISDDIVSFSADVVGVLLGALLGYLLGLRQERKIDREKDDRKRTELRAALRAEIGDIQQELAKEPLVYSELFKSIRFDFVFLDMPTFTSIVNSGQLLLLGPELIKSLRELNNEIHEHNTAQTIFAGVSGTQSPEELNSHMKEFERTLKDPSQQTNDRLAEVLKVVVAKRKTISQLARLLIDELGPEKERPIQVGRPNGPDLERRS